MTSPSQVTDGEMSQFKGLLTNGGLTAELIRAAIENHDVAKAMVKGGKVYLGLIPSEGKETDAITFPPDGHPYRTKPRNGNGETRTNEYVVPVSYQLPSYKELNGSVFDWASELFSNKYTWKEHEYVRGLVDRTPGERDLLVKHFTEEEIRQMGGLTSENVIAWANAHGYRVGVREELVALGRVHPDLQRQFPTVALGSFTVYGGGRGVAILGRYGVGRYLDHGWFGDRWSASYRFLLVRKPA